MTEKDYIFTADEGDVFVKLLLDYKDSFNRFIGVPLTIESMQSLIILVSSVEQQLKTQLGRSDFALVVVQENYEGSTTSLGFRIDAVRT